MFLMPKVTRVLGVAFACWLVLAGVSARAGSHLWVINEVFSNSDGTIQFVEMYNCCEPLEIALAFKYVHSHTTLKQFPLPANLVEDTTDRYILLATAGFAALPGAPTPDHIIEDNFFDSDSITMFPRMTVLNRHSLESFLGGQKGALSPRSGAIFS